MSESLIDLLAYLSPFSDEIVLFIKSVNLYCENENKCFNKSENCDLAPSKNFFLGMGISWVCVDGFALFS